MTANSTPITTAPYGNGTYIASASSEFNAIFTSYYAFDKFNSSQPRWISVSAYSGATGLYSRSPQIITSVVSVGNVAGEFLQLQIPPSIVLTSYSIQNSPESGSVPRSPRNWLLVASTNGTTWTQIDARTNQSYTSPSQTLTFTVSGASSYNSFRLIVQSVQASNDGYVHIGEMRLFGF
jgi:hypothetical protein